MFIGDWSSCDCDCGRDLIAKGPASDLLARAGSHAAFQACCAHGSRAGIWVLGIVRSEHRRYGSDAKANGKRKAIIRATHFKETVLRFLGAAVASERRKHGLVLVGRTPTAVAVALTQSPSCYSWEIESIAGTNTRERCCRAVCWERVLKAGLGDLLSSCFFEDIMVRCIYSATFRLPPAVNFAILKSLKSGEAVISGASMPPSRSIVRSGCWIPI
jgi:hypothetical protein